jgi:site-specific recombinase XerD
MTGRWDKGLDFKETLRRLLAFKRWVRSSPEITVTRRIQLRNVNILLLALLNGLRVSEAIECYYKWLDDPSAKEYTVKVAKSKKEKYRVCVAPGLDSMDHELTKDLERPTPNNMESWTIQHFKFNTHSLRHAFINHMLQQGYDPAVVSRIMALSKLEIIVSHIQEKRAKEALLKEVEKALESV